MINVVEDDMNYPFGEKLLGEELHLRTVLTDVFQDGEWQRGSQLVFNDGSTTPPLDLPSVQLNKNYIGSLLRGVGLAMSWLLVLLSFSFCWWTHLNRAKKIVKASQPIFLYMICSGCCLLGTSITLMSIDDQIASNNVCSVLCVTVPWLFCVGWILSFSALFAKTIRVNRIFHNPVRFSRIKVTIWDVMTPVVALLSVATIVLLVWTVRSPPYFVRKVNAFDLYDRVIETKGTCSYRGVIPYAITLGVVLLGTLLFTVQQAYQARHISTEFAESEYIFLVLLAVFVVSILGIPVLFLVEENPSARFFTLASIIFLIDLSILLMIFIPKIRQQGRHEMQQTEKGTLDSNRQSISTRFNQQVTVTGIAFDSSKYGDQREHINDSDAGGSEYSSGILILNHPRTVKDLEQQLHDLRNEVDRLRIKRRQGGESELTVHVENSQEGRNTIGRESSREERISSGKESSQEESNSLCSGEGSLQGGKVNGNEDLSNNDQESTPRTRITMAGEIVKLE
jgi:hypothetical protein